MAAKAAVRRAAKAALAGVLDASGARWLLPRAGRRGPRVRIFAWHRVVPEPARLAGRKLPGLFTSTATFDRQLAWLCRRYVPATMSEAVEAIAGTGAPRSGDLFVATFDDAYQDFLEHALPVLRKHRVPATLYVPAGAIESGEPLLHDRLHHLLAAALRQGVEPRDLRALPQDRAALERAWSADPVATLERLLAREPRARNVSLAEALEARLGEPKDAALPGSELLSWEELRACRAMGVELGSHTLDHACLPAEDQAELRRQILGSRRVLEEGVKATVQHFAYPNGWWCRAAIRALVAGGYRSAVTTEARSARRGDDPYSLARTCVNEGHSRGIAGFSEAVTACNLDGALEALGLAAVVPGERPDPRPGPARAVA